MYMTGIKTHFSESFTLTKESLISLEEYFRVQDALLLEGAIYHLLKKYFRSEPYYVDLLELFHETSYQTEMGQLVYLITTSEDVVDLSKFSLDKRKFIVIYKTAYYCFYLPVALAMYMTGIKTASSFTLAKEILVPLGEYFQVQDDYLDCFGSPEDIGKTGTDVIDNKCSWLVNTVLQIVSPAQRKILDDNYGRTDAACEARARTKALYEEIGLRQRYAARGQ